MYTAAVDEAMRLPYGPRRYSLKPYVGLWYFNVPGVKGSSPLSSSHLIQRKMPGLKALNPGLQDSFIHKIKVYISAQFSILDAANIRYFSIQKSGFKFQFRLCCIQFADTPITRMNVSDYPHSLSP